MSSMIRKFVNTSSIIVKVSIQFNTHTHVQLHVSILLYSSPRLSALSLSLTHTHTHYQNANILLTVVEPSPSLPRRSHGGRGHHQQITLPPITVQYLHQLNVQLIHKRVSSDENSSTVQLSSLQPLSNTI